MPRASLHSDLECSVLLASGLGTLPRANSSFGSLALPQACYSPAEGNHTWGPLAPAAVQQDAAWLQRTSRTTNKKVKHTKSMVETLTCNLHLYCRLWQTSHQLQGDQVPQSPAQWVQVNSMCGDFTLSWWSQKTINDRATTGCQTQLASPLCKSSTSEQTTFG